MRKRQAITFQGRVPLISHPPHTFPSPSPPPPEPLPAGRWVDISRDGSTIAIGASTSGFTGGAMWMCRGADFMTRTHLTSTLGAVNEYGNSVATNADGSIVICGVLRTGFSIDGYIAVRHGTDWADETVVEPAGSSIFLGYTGGKTVGISDDGSIIVTTDGTSLYVCSGVDWATVTTLTPSGGIWSVAISGDGTVVAAGNGGGQVHVYSGAAYATHTVVTQIPDGSGFNDLGWSVSLNSDGSVLAAGDIANGSGQRGAAYLFTGAGWATEQKFTTLGPYDYTEHYGWGVDISPDGSVAAFCAWEGHSGTSMEVPTVFRYSDSGYSVETQVPVFAYDVALNEDGTIMVASAGSPEVFTF